MNNYLFIIIIFILLFIYFFLIDKFKFKCIKKRENFNQDKPDPNIHFKGNVFVTDSQNTINKFKKMLNKKSVNINTKDNSKKIDLDKNNLILLDNTSSDILNNSYLNTYGNVTQVPLYELNNYNDNSSIIKENTTDRFPKLISNIGIDTNIGCSNLGGGDWKPVEKSSNLNGDLNEGSGGKDIYLCNLKKQYKYTYNDETKKEEGPFSIEDGGESESENKRIDYIDDLYLSNDSNISAPCSQYRDDEDQCNSMLNCLYASSKDDGEGHRYCTENKDERFKYDITTENYRIIDKPNPDGLLNGDLNQGTGEDTADIFLWQSQLHSNKYIDINSQPITDLYLSDSSTCPEGYSLVDTKNTLNGDLNQGAGGKDIFLCQKKRGSGVKYNPIGNIKDKAETAPRFLDKNGKEIFYNKNNENEIPFMLYFPVTGTSITYDDIQRFNGDKSINFVVKDSVNASNNLNEKININKQTKTINSNVLPDGSNGSPNKIKPYYTNLPNVNRNKQDLILFRTDDNPVQLLHRPDGPLDDHLITDIGLANRNCNELGQDWQQITHEPTLNGDLTQGTGGSKNIILCTKKQKYIYDSNDNGPCSANWTPSGSDSNCSQYIKNMNDLKIAIGKCDCSHYDNNEDGCNDTSNCKYVQAGTSRWCKNDAPHLKDINVLASGMNGDLNQEAGGRDVSLCQTQGPDNNSTPILDLHLVENSPIYCPEGYEWVTASNTGKSVLSSTDLNEGAGGKYLYLCAKRRKAGDKNTQVTYRDPSTFNRYDGTLHNYSYIGSTPGRKLNLCEADCDDHNDCSGKLKCRQRQGNEAVPGCYGNMIPGSDVCYNPEYENKVIESCQKDVSFKGGSYINKYVSEMRNICPYVNKGNKINTHTCKIFNDAGDTKSHIFSYEPSTNMEGTYHVHVDSEGHEYHEGDEEYEDMVKLKKKLESESEEQDIVGDM